MIAFVVAENSIEFSQLVATSMAHRIFKNNEVQADFL